MDLRLAKLKAASLYFLHNVSTLNQCRKLSCDTVVCKHFVSYQDKARTCKADVNKEIILKNCLLLHSVTCFPFSCPPLQFAPFYAIKRHDIFPLSIDQRNVWYYMAGQMGARWWWQLFESLRYKPEGRGVDSGWCHWNFSFTFIRPHYGPGFDSVSNRNQYQECFLGKIR
jgi:hypothetical protein